MGFNRNKKIKSQSPQFAGFGFWVNVFFVELPYRYGWWVVACPNFTIITRIGSNVYRKIAQYQN